MPRIKKQWILIFLLAIVLMFSGNMLAVAQDQVNQEIPSPELTETPSRDERQSEELLTSSTSTSLKVKSVKAEKEDERRRGDRNGEENEKPRVKIGDRIRVEVEGLSEEVRNERIDPRRFILFLNGYALPGVHGELVGENLLAFQLKRTDESQEVWSSIIGGSIKDREATVSVGFVGRQELPPSNSETAPQIEVILISWRLWIYILICTAILVVFCKFGIDSLQDSGEKSTFSLGRTQMAWWFFLIIASFGFIYSITGDYTNIVTSQAVTLLGIGAGTGVSAALIDEGNKAGEKKRPVAGFLQDILYNQNGLCFYRFQIFIWTIVLGLIFVFEVLKNLKMPEFDSTLLVLQGVSAGTYLGFKFQGVTSNTSGSSTSESSQQGGS